LKRLLVKAKELEKKCNDQKVCKTKSGWEWFEGKCVNRAETITANVSKEVAEEAHKQTKKIKDMLARIEDDMKLLKR